MALSEVEVLGAGCSLWFSVDAGAIWKELENGLQIGETGSEGEFVPTTPIKKTTHTYIAGMETPTVTQATFNHQPGLVPYKEFIDAAKARKKVKLKKVFTTGDEGVFDAVLNGFKVGEPENNGAVKATVSWQQSGEVAWGVTAVGGG